MPGTTFLHINGALEWTHSNDAVDINENEAHSPCKNLEGRPICSPQKISISRACEALRNQIRMRALVPRERNYYKHDVKMSFLILSEFKFLCENKLINNYTSQMSAPAFNELSKENYEYLDQRKRINSCMPRGYTLFTRGFH